MATAQLADSAVKWTMGLGGKVASWANVTAVSLVLVMFYQGQADQRQLAKEDRAMFREELRVLHDDSTHKWAAITATQRELTKLTDAVQQLVVEFRLERARGKEP